MLTIIKLIGDSLAFCVALPAVLSYRLAAIVLGPCRAFPGWSQAFALVPGISGVYLRRAFYRSVLPSCGGGVCISFGTVFSHPTARLGNDVYVGIGCMLGDITLEDDVLIGSHVSIINGRRQHGTANLDVPVRDQLGEYPRVAIGRDSWIGDRAVVTENVGQHCIVATSAVVTKPIPDFAIVAGIPARIVNWRNAVPNNAGAAERRDMVEQSCDTK